MRWNEADCAVVWRILFCRLMLSVDLNETGCSLRTYTAGLQQFHDTCLTRDFCRGERHFVFYFLRFQPQVESSHGPHEVPHRSQYSKIIHIHIIMRPKYRLCATLFENFYVPLAYFVDFISSIPAYKSGTWPRIFYKVRFRLLLCYFRRDSTSSCEDSSSTM